MRSELIRAGRDLGRRGHALRAAAGIVIVALASALAGGASAARLPVTQVAITPASGMIEGDRVLAPMAFVRFCMHQPDDCARGGGDRIGLDGVTLADLVSVNLQVNRGIQPKRKGMEGGLKTWEIAPRAGDCNDYAVTKRHALLRRGYPAGALLLAVVETNSGEGHLVLIVRTDRGDYVLDNLISSIRPWTATSHRWIKRQSTFDPHAWVSIEDGSLRLGPANL